MYTLDDLIEEYNVDRAGIEREKRKLLAQIEAYELAEIRKQAGLTQVQLAESMGVSQKRISEIEHGRAGAIKLSTLRGGSRREAEGGDRVPHGRRHGEVAARSAGGLLEPCASALS